MPQTTRNGQRQKEETDPGKREIYKSFLKQYTVKTGYSQTRPHPLKVSVLTVRCKALLPEIRKNAQLGCSMLIIWV